MHWSTLLFIRTFWDSMWSPEPRERIWMANYIFQQDSVPAHTAQTAQEFLRENMVEFLIPAV